jgi:hypothetical protein
MKSRFLLYFLYLSFFSVNAQQNLNAIDKILSHDFQKLTNARLGGDNYPYDSIEKYNTIFRTDLIKYTTQNPSTLKYPFDSLSKSKIEILSSSDNFFRIYSWNTWRGGTQLDFENVMQYTNGSQVFIKANRDTGVDNDHGYIFHFIQLYSLQTGNKTYYLGVYLGIFSSQDAGMGIKIFSIENNLLNDTVRLIKTGSGMNNDIYFSFKDYSDVDNGKRPLQLIRYDTKNKIIRIPVVLENEKVTKRFINYKFTGSYFEKMK